MSNTLETFHTEERMSKVPKTRKSCVYPKAARKVVYRSLVTKGLADHCQRFDFIFGAIGRQKGFNQGNDTI